MGYVNSAAMRLYAGSAGTDGPLVYVIDSPEHPFPIADVASGLAAHVATVPIANWDDALTPYPAPALYRNGSAFGGHASTTLTELDVLLPQFEEANGLAPRWRAICGYSLGGLFALQAFIRGDTFAACACLSGSLWYEGWVERLRAQELRLAGRYAFLSLGSKERKAPNPVQRRVATCMDECSAILRASGCEVDCMLGPGDHFHFVAERLATGLTALDAFFGRTGAAAVV